MDFIKSLKTFTKANVFTKFNLKNKTAYKTGGFADYFVQVNSVKDIKDAIEFATENNINYKVVGNLTNILLSDKGYHGAIISLENLNDITFYENHVVASSGAKLSSLSRLCALNGYLDNVALCGIPASIGGATVMNAGAFGKNISDGIIDVTTLINGKIVKFYKQDCGFSYRNSIFLNSDYVILSVRLSLKDFIGSEKSVLILGDLLKKRKTLQPSGRSCGSVFKNKLGVYYAGELIDKAGLKGAKIGGAVVSNKHANFILAEDGATSTDIKNLIDLVKERVKEKFGFDLKEEVEFLGEF